MGGTSGLGQEVAKLFLKQGCKVGIAGRRENLLKSFCEAYPSQMNYEVIDITTTDAPQKLEHLIEKMGGLDLYFHASGVGYSNIDLEIETERRTANTNVLGLVQMVDTAFNFFKKQGHGHIGVISSIAGTRGMGAAPAYSATKKFQQTYINALVQLARIQNHHITFTDIRPGFVDTELLNPDKHYPMMMPLKKVSRIIFKALIHKKRVKTIDWRFRIVVFFWKCIPQSLWEKLKISN